MYWTIFIVAVARYQSRCSCDQNVPSQRHVERLQVVEYESDCDRQEIIPFGSGSLRLSCKYKLPIRFEYIAKCDNGCFKRSKRFSLDSRRRCQQKSFRVYPRTCISPLCGDAHCHGVCLKKCARQRRGSMWNNYRISSKSFTASCDKSIGYDRGHQIPANHLDYNATLISMSNRMINISPQAATMNRGAWLRTEKLIECWRDIEVLHVVGGSVWNDDDDEPGMEGRNELFRASHDVQTPVYFWKVIRAKENGIIASQLGIHHIAFWVPNTEDAASKKINSYVVSLATLEGNLANYGERITFDESKKDSCYHGLFWWSCRAWPMPKNCDLS